MWRGHCRQVNESEVPLVAVASPTRRVAQPTPVMTIALLYTRVSSDEQAREGLSLDAQLAEIRRYAAHHGWAIGGEYTDIEKGTRDDRQDYQRLLAAARSLTAGGSHVVVVVAALDRFGRHLLERVRSREELKALGVATHSVREGGEVSDLVANVLGAVAEEEVRRLGERVKATRAHVIASGWWPVTRAPWGYLLRPPTAEERATGAPKGVLQLDELTLPYVLEAYQRVADGASIRAVFYWVSSLPLEVRGGRSMPFAQVRDMLSRPVYAARPDHGDPDVLARPVGRWPQLIPDSLFRRVQAQITRHAVLPRQARGDYLLTGMIVCPRCGGRVNGDFYRHTYRYYRCASHCNAPQLGHDLRCMFAAPCAPIETAVLAEVGELLQAVSTASDDLQRAWDDLTQPTDVRRVRAQRIAALEREAAKARTRLKEAALKLVDGLLDKEAYDLVRDVASSDLAATQEELRRLEATPDREVPSLDVVLAQLPSWQEALADASVPIQRGVLRPLIERVVPVRIARGQYTVEITWTRLGEMLRELPQAGGHCHHA
jgi:DNA invertase Pin-like site-specific DNA recombinase